MGLSDVTLTGDLGRVVACLQGQVAALQVAVLQVALLQVALRPAAALQVAVLQAAVPPVALRPAAALLATLRTTAVALPMATGRPRKGMARRTARSPGASPQRRASDPSRSGV